jgi:hypothetical protein
MVPGLWRGAYVGQVVSQLNFRRSLPIFFSSTPRMAIQRCPVEVLDRIFEWIAFLSPRNAPAALSSVMMVCSHFQTVAKRHLIRVICLPTAEKAVAFASFLKGVVNSGEYATSFLSIEHLALVGRGWAAFRNRSEAEAEAERLAPFIVSAAAPSLRSLTLFGIGLGHKFDNTQPYYALCVPSSVNFPLLCDLVALEQQVLVPNIRGLADEQAYRSRYPNLRRLYVLGDRVTGSLLPSALPTLDCLRLEMLDSTRVTIPPRQRVQHVRSLIIDAPRYSEWLFHGCVGEPQWQHEYDARVLEYRALAKEIGGLDGSGVLVPPDDHTLYVNRERILLGWMDAVGGSEGCWSMDWRPTILYNSYDTD